MLKQNDNPYSHFHSAEIAIQQRLGISKSVDEKTKQLIRDEMPQQHRDFFSQLPFIMIATTDDTGQPWAIPITGAVPFISTPNSRTLTIQYLPVLDDYLHLDIHEGKKIGVLGIDLQTRRRNRMNGIIQQRNACEFSIHVEQSFGNCRKYIQQREPNDTPPLITSTHPAAITTSHNISTVVKKLIEHADTFFIASRTQHLDNDVRHGLDASHRGGHPGFVKVTSKNTLCFPDFSGNRFFNTLGNIVSDGRVGLTFFDFLTGDCIFISGVATILWNTEKELTFTGAERFVEVSVTKIIAVPHLMPFTHQLIAASPALKNTGTW